VHELELFRIISARSPPIIDEGITRAHMKFMNRRGLNLAEQLVTGSEGFI
jgi:hypothetical protein